MSQAWGPGAHCGMDSESSQQTCAYPRMQWGSVKLSTWPPQMWQSDLFTCSEQVRILVFHLSTGVPRLAIFQGFSCPASSISSWKWWGCGSWKPHRTGCRQVSKDRSGPPSTWSCQRPINGRIITVQDVQYTYLLSHDLMQPINSFWMDFLIPVRHPGCEGDNVQLTRQQVIHGGDLTRRREGLQTPWFHVRKHFEEVRTGNSKSLKDWKTLLVGCDWFSFRKSKLLSLL